MSKQPVSYERQTLANPNPIARFAHTRRYSRSVELASEWLPQGGKVVDFGAGTGLFLSRLQDVRPDAALVAIEPFMAKSSNPAIVYEERLADVSAVELVTCFEVIEHLLGNEVEEFLADAHRALAPGGHLLISVPIMQGPVLTLKVANSMLLHHKAADYNFWQYVRGTLGLSVPRVPNSRKSHRGFDFRALRKQIQVHFKIDQEFYSPLRGLPWTVNSQAFFVCSPK